jgi:hypothetical protein
VEQFPAAVDGNKNHDIRKVFRDDPVEVKAFPDLLVEGASRARDKLEDGP